MAAERRLASGRAERRLAFGRIAELYDETRPSYPAALVEDVMAFAGARADDRAVEVGAGTGKATIAFAERGLRIVALEPSAEMARILRANIPHGPVSVEETDFETWRAGRDFRLLYSGQAWHWIAPEVRYIRAAEVLVPGGALAVFWNRPRWDGCEFRAELEEAYRRTAPELGTGVGPGPMYPGMKTRRQWWTDWSRELEQASGFTDPEARSYVWDQPYTTETYVRLLQSHSDHVVLADDVRRDLFDAVAKVIDRHDGMLELEYVTTLAMARRTGS